jgi:Amt family ammonium transporter
MDGVSNTYEGGWWERHWIQLGYQLAAATTCAAWSFIVSCILLFVINKIPGLHIRCTEEEELMGLDFKYLADVDVEDSGVDISAYGIVTPGVKSTPRSETSGDGQVVPEQSREKAA